MLTFLCRAAGQDASGSDWSNKAVSWAKKNGLTNGISFSNKKDCPRSDVVYFLWKQLADKTTEEDTSRPDPAGARAAITKSLLAFDQEIKLSDYNLSIAEANALMKEMTFAGEAGMFVSNWSVSPVYQENGTSNAGRIWITYPHYSPKEDLLKVKEKIKQITAEVITPGMSEYEIAKALHDWLVLHNKYDMRYYSNSLPDSAYTPYAALITGTSVCNGYGEAYKAMARYNGLKCLYVSGYGHTGRHGWNLVNIDGQWYHVDVTWDDPTPDRAGYVRYNYFLKSDAYMSAHNHSKWQEESIFEWSSEYACTSTKYDGSILPDTNGQGSQTDTGELAKEIVARYLTVLDNLPYTTEAELRAADLRDIDMRVHYNLPTGAYASSDLTRVRPAVEALLAQEIAARYPNYELREVFWNGFYVHRLDVEAELNRRSAEHPDLTDVHVAELEALVQDAVRNGDIHAKEYVVSFPDVYTDGELRKTIKKMTTDGYSFDGYTAKVDYDIKVYGSTYIKVINLRAGE